jgi:hypothetical protein
MKLWIPISLDSEHTAFALCADVRGFAEDFQPVTLLLTIGMNGRMVILLPLT